MPIASIVLWLCFASTCRKAVMGTTTGTLGRAEAEIQPVSCSAALAATASSSCLGDVTQQDCSAWEEHGNVALEQLLELGKGL